MQKTRSFFGRLAVCLFIGISSLLLAGCPEASQSSDQRANAMQERVLQEGVSQTGMPAISNFRERKTLKMIYELRDKEDLATYTYLKFPNGTLKLLCPSIGFAISDATGYTGPEKIVRDSTSVFGTVTQAEPNGLFTPAESSMVWVVCVAPDGKPAPIQMQSDFVTLPYKLEQ